MVRLNFNFRHCILLSYFLLKNKPNMLHWDRQREDALEKDGLLFVVLSPSAWVDTHRSFFLKLNGHLGSYSISSKSDLNFT